MRLLLWLFGSDGISVGVEITADLAQTPLLADWELGQDWRERRPEQKR